MDKSNNSFLRECIVESALDDVESLDSLKKDVASWAKEEGQPYSDEEFVTAIRALIRDGKLRAFRYDTTKQRFEPAPIDENVPVSDLADLWFRAKRKVE